ncbi:hypothetical protein KC340_g1263 [Hortaea werneckii]|nr:hypothetical protein KC342_g1216 [Hortaea werneckii]KAI7106815.1 hypothetical protein KC339_g2833 [Hortaea werneckii]KAI7245366.1 hypothetical protein KC365_g538 [Hortaea werneckii]KAI7337409.1 hypothetical protein KC340_g1263 [Hortaea werneckii]KAI7405620.1 hypothetical protein KC328_g1353 [Hortaea werneckii]
MFSWSLLSALTLAVSFKQCLAGDSRSNSDRDWHWPHQSEQLHDCHSIESELSPRLSPDAAIILPGNASFDSFEVRASSPRIEPNFSAVVEVSTEEDVQHTVRYANRCKTPFLVVGGAHGWQSTLNNANGGIQINMRRMQQVELKANNDGSIVQVGGGVTQRHLTQTLYKLGKQAVTGLCECTSVIGPLMGGGHSALQGFHGFSSDNILSARVVLADGEVVTTSASEHPDLFWALRGAGHNFGIVTSFEVKGYDVPEQEWTIVSVVYTEDKLEAFVDALNDVNNGGDHPAELVLAGSITRLAAFDTENPVVAYQLSYLGTPDEVEPYLARFRQAGPVSVSTAEKVAYKDYYIATQNGYNQTTCQKDKNISGYAISLNEYNRTAMRAAFNHFSTLTADDRYNTSVWLLESYGSRGVWAQDYSTSAVPAAERDIPNLTVPITWWAGDDPEAREKAEFYGKLMRSSLAEGAGETSNSSHIYVNYAMGGEELGQMYGDEERVARLQGLKKRYDPMNRFGFYMPLI